MFDRYFCPRVATRLRAGPDAGWLASFLAVLHRRGYARLTVQVYLREAGRVLAIPRKRFDRPLLGHLTRAEVEAVLAAPDSADWSGRRDRALFTLMYNTGARVSEAIGVSRADIRLGPSATVRIRGKGRKDRAVPLWKATAKLLAGWLAEIDGSGHTPLFPNRYGRPLSRSGVEHRLDRAVIAAAGRCPSLLTKNVSPHTLRHTTAMHLLQAGVDVTLIVCGWGTRVPRRRTCTSRRTWS